MKLRLPPVLRAALLLILSASYVPCADAKMRNDSKNATISDLQSYKATGHDSDEDYYSNGTKYDCGDGGALHYNSSLTMSDIGVAMFGRNYAYDSGGAIRANSVSFHDVDKLSFVLNTANGFMEPCDDGYGTRIHGGGALCSCSTIDDCQNVNFISNKANSGSGGAIVNRNDNLTISDCVNLTFKKNVAAADGGAIALKKGYYVATWYATNCDLSIRNNKTFEFSENSAGGNGGALDSWFVGIYNNKKSLFKNNKACVNGGAVRANYVYVGNENELVQFLNNSAENGGAIYASSYSGYASSPRRTVYIYDNETVLFAGNSAEKGGAIYANSSKGTAYITNNSKVTFENNIGGAIYANSDVQIQGNEQVCFSGNGTAIDAESVFYQRQLIRLVLFNCTIR